jgi:hypothetical protein
MIPAIIGAMSARASGTQKFDSSMIPTISWVPIISRKISRPYQCSDECSGRFGHRSLCRWDEVLEAIEAEDEKDQPHQDPGEGGNIAAEESRL